MLVKGGWALIAARGKISHSYLTLYIFFSLVFAFGLQLSSTLTQISERGNPSIGLAVVIMRRLMSFVGKVLIQSQDRAREGAGWKKKEGGQFASAPVERKMRGVVEKREME